MALAAPKSASSERVKVIVRSRPLSQKEINEGHVSVVDVSPQSCEIEVRRPSNQAPGGSNNDDEANSERKVFVFDAVYDGGFTQPFLYEDAFRPLVDSVLEGFNGCVFAYGQTGTGKTYTMEGNCESEETQGVIPNAFAHIFRHISNHPQKRYLVRASYLEIYQEEIRDLLCKDGIKKCELKENKQGVYVKDLSSFLCGNFNEINELMSKGNKNRSVGATNMNEHSSRSHAIFMITVEVSEVWPDGRAHFKVGKLNLVDLAGSERQTKTGATGDRLKEATKINLSLSALGNVIAALVDGRSTHIPYRDSKLTRLLQDSLGGNSRTIMVATVGPASFNYDETMTTLRYASRAKRIKNKPKVNEDPKDAMLREYQEEIARLRAQLLKKKAMYSNMAEEGGDGGGGGGESQNQNSAKNFKTRTRARTAHADSAGSGSGSSSSSSAGQLRGPSEQEDRLKELAPLLQPYGLTVDQTTDPKYVMEVLERRREALLQDTVTVKEEKDRLLRKLEETQERVKLTETECSKLSDRIQWLESKVLNGGKSLLDHTNEQQKLIEMKQQELAESRRREEGIRLKLAEHELTANEIKGALVSRQMEVEGKLKKLQKLRFKLYSTREELEKSHKDHYRQRKHLVALQVDLRRELKLKRLIIDNFVPTVIRKLVESRIQRKEKDDGYYLVPVETTVIQTVKRPAVNKSLKLPLFHRSDSGTVHAIENVHYHDENILQLQLEMPKHLTNRYIPSNSNPYITSLMKKTFDLALQETVIDVTRFSHRKRSSHSSQSQHKQGGLAHAII